MVYVIGGVSKNIIRLGVEREKCPVQLDSKAMLRQALWEMHGNCDDAHTEREMRHVGSFHWNYQGDVIS